MTGIKAGLCDNHSEKGRGLPDLRRLPSLPELPADMKAMRRQWNFSKKNPPRNNGRNLDATQV
jgi:hypothetical protein